VTHAPPRGIHEGPDRAHRGFAAVRTFLQWFQPRYHLHGHTHIYDRRTVTTTQFGRTTVMNVYSARTLDIS
jgi:Icc-related predicted phosphoesterase